MLKYSYLLETVDNKCSFSVDNGNEKAFMEAILKVKENGKSLYSSDCVKWAQAKFNRKNNYEQYINLYLTM